MEEKEYKEFYEDDVYKDESEKNPKKYFIIGGIVLGVIILLLLLFIFGFGGSKKPVDNNNNLKNIFIEGGELEPAFNKDVLEYDLKTSSPSIRISCVKESDNSTVKGCDLGELVTADLTEDIVITVIAADKAEKKYVLRVNSGYEGIIVNVSGNESEWSNKDIDLKISAEGDNPLAEEPYSFDNGTTWQSSDTKTFDSNASIKIRVKDNQGNISVAKDVDIKIDKTEPQVEVTGSVPSEQVTDTAVTISSTVTPAETPSGYTYQWYNGNTAIEGAVESTYVTSNSGNYTLEVTTGAGNKVMSNNYIVSNKNTVKPVITSIDGLPKGWIDSDVTITVKVNSPNGIHEEGYSFDGGKTWQNSASKTVTSSAALSVIVKDEKSNVSEAKAVNIKIDKTKPSVKINGSVVSGKTTTNNVKLTAVPSPASAPSGYKYQWYKDSQAISGATKKTYTATASGNYMVRVTNGVNKTATSSTYSVKKQTGTTTSSNSTVSITKVTGNPSSWTSSNVTLKVTASASKGLHSKAYSFDNGKTWQASASKTFKSNQTVHIRVRDKNGKISADNVQTINKIDRTGPSVKFEPNGNSSATKTATTKVTVTDSQVKKLGTLYFALSTSAATQPTFTAKFQSGQSIQIANGTGIYYLWIKAVDSLGNTTVVKSKSFKINDPSSGVSPDIQISAYKWVDEKKTGSALKTVKNSNLEFTSWVNHQYMMVITAKAASGTIKSLKWEVNGSQYATYDEANVTAAWGRGETKTYSYSSASISKEIGMYADGVRLGKITVTDSKGNKRTVKVRFNIDRTAPKLEFKISGTKSGSAYKSGAKVTATCTDNLSGLTYMKTYDTQDTSDVVTFNGKATKTKAQTITLVTTGSSRNITTTCKDSLGNSTGAKKSSSYAIGTSSTTSSTSSTINATISSVTCPSGYSKTNDNKCRKGTGLYSYSCPSGYTKIGDGPTARCEKTTSAKCSYTCPSGYSLNSSNKCTKSATAYCPSGKGSLSGGKCVRTYDASRHGAYGEIFYSCGGQASASSVCKEVTNPKYKCDGKETTSKTCTKSSTKKCTCSSGTLSGSKCYIHASTTKTETYAYATPTKTTYSCPSGYSLSGTKCYK